MAFADGHSISMAVIPSIAVNHARSGFIVEALAVASCTMIKPEYYDVILKSKLSLDKEKAPLLKMRRCLWRLSMRFICSQKTYCRIFPSFSHFLVSFFLAK